MRPKKIRLVKCDPKARCFVPTSGQLTDKEVVLSLDEFEAIRLLDDDGLSQEEVASLMNVHRSTISRIITQARRKVAQALVNIQTIKIEGGCCKVLPLKQKRKI